MKVRSLVVAVGLGVALLIAAPGSASANIMWCAGDPPVQVRTPGGHWLTVNNYLYISPMYRHLASQITADGYALSDGHGGSLITVHVHVPRGLDHVFVVSDEQRYQITTSGAGPGGTEITLTLDVPVS